MSRHPDRRVVRPMKQKTNQYWYFYVHHSLTEESKGGLASVGCFSSAVWPQKLTHLMMTTPAWVSRNALCLYWWWQGWGWRCSVTSYRGLLYSLCLSCSSLPFPHSSLVCFCSSHPFGICLFYPPTLFPEWHITSITFFLLSTPFFLVFGQILNVDIWYVIMCLTTIIYPVLLTSIVFFSVFLCHFSQVLYNFPV